MTPQELKTSIIQGLGVVIGEQKARESIAAFERLVSEKAAEGASRVVKQGLIVSAVMTVAFPLVTWLWRRAKQKRLAA